MAREIINMILWHPEIDINQTIITYIHRGAPGNLKKINGTSVERLERGFLILKEGTQIPYHRIIKIENKNKISLEKVILNNRRFLMTSSALVKDYMTKEVITVTPETPNEEVIMLMKGTGHDGFPVRTNGEVIGMVTAFDLLLKEWLPYVQDIMSTDIVVAEEDMSINDAARVMFRMGISRLPVIDKDAKLVGILTNTDIVRSHIERSTPMKVDYFKRTLEQLYDINTKIVRMKVPIERIRPTQDKIYADELQGRTYEIKRGLAEPTIIAKSGERYILVDGHHRTAAALKLGCNNIDSYVIELDKDIHLGLEKTADKNGIFSFKDIEVIDDAQHPLIAITSSLRKEARK